MGQFASPQMIMPIVIGIFAPVIAFLFYTPMVEGNDEYYRQYFEHCGIGKETTRVLRQNQDVAAAGGPGSLVTLAEGTSGACKVGSITVVGTFPGTVAAAGTYTMYTESGTAVAITAKTADTAAADDTLPTGAKWREALNITRQFGSVSEMLISLVPLFIVLSFIGSTWGTLFLKMRSGDTGMGSLLGAIGIRVGVLVALLAAVSLAPTYLQFGNTASVATSGQYTSTIEFADLIDLIFSILPVGLTIAIMGLAGLDMFKTGRDVRASMASS